MCHLEREKKVSKKIIISIIVLSLFVSGSFADSLGNELKIVYADSIMTLIEDGKPVEFDGVLIKGNLHISKMKLIEKETEEGIKRKAVDSKIFLKNSIISDTVIFSQVLFTNDVAFMNVKFENIVYFYGAYFQKSVFLWDVEFEKGADFGPSHFASQSAFYKVRFEGIAHFSGSDFYNTTSFVACKFDTLANYRGANFREENSFMDAWFEDIADFTGANFKEPVTFLGAYFKGLADFAYVRFDDEVNFLSSIFEGPVDFSNINAQTIGISWEQIKGKLRYNPRAYSVLIKNFKECGQFEDADEAYYEYRVRKREIARLHPLINLLEYIFLDFTCGYGTKPFWAVRFSVILILIFSFFYIWSGAIKERDKPEQSSRNILKRFGNATYFSVNTFTTVGFGDWYPAKTHSKIVAMIEGFLGWIMLSLFLITLARTWIR